MKFWVRMNKIIFTLNFGDEWIPKDYYPVPGVKAVPEWYKKMETSYADDKKNEWQVKESQTMKRCMPIIDSITTGYILKTYTDLVVNTKDGVTSFLWANDTQDTISLHPAYQVVNYKGLDLSQGVPKIRNPWCIETPAGYSSLFINPPHRPDCGIKILEGIVDTDKYTASIQFPFIVDEGFTGVIPAGTPIVQILPFKRDSFRMEIGGKKEQQKNLAVSKLLRSTWINGYRSKFRTRKDYL
jgi:hypothetical protein